MSPTRTLATEAQYRRRAAALCDQAARDLGYTSAEYAPSKAVADHLIAQKAGMSYNTWHQKRASLLFAWGERLEAATDRLTAEGLRSAIATLKAEPQTGAKRRGEATSANKAKRVRDQDAETLLAVLTEHVGKWKSAATAVQWIRASMLTGLRPSEWARAGLIVEDGATLLVTFNGKIGNQRANGMTRRLRFDPANTTAEDIAVVEAHLAFLDTARLEHKLEAVQDEVKRTLRRANEIAFPDLKKARAEGTASRGRKAITLYSFRHQFSADAKKAGLSQAEVGALLGHASDATAGKHYAKRRSGSKPLKVSPIASEVATVRRRAKPAFVPRALRPEVEPD